MTSIVLLFSLVCLITTTLGFGPPPPPKKPLHNDGLRYEECKPTADKCVFNFVIQEKMTMYGGVDKSKHPFPGPNLVYAHGGNLYLYNVDKPGADNTVDPESTISVDGVKRMIQCVNGEMPGPSIVVYEDQTVIVHVQNNLLISDATIHWHGLHQKGTYHFDGVPMITQCPIAAGGSMTYEFKASPRGTFWYHSHVGAQRADGVYGAFIIKERAPKVVAEDLIMTVNGDWHHDSGAMVWEHMKAGNFEFFGNKYHGYLPTNSLDGGRFSNVPFKAGLINGKGRYKSHGKVINAPLTKFTVKAGSLYRFRAIGVGTNYPMRVSVDGHVIQVISSDGYDFKSVDAESVVIHPGERFDFLLKADQKKGNYWIRAESMQAKNMLGMDIKDHSVEAILHYDGASAAEPTTSRKACSKGSECVVVNCPFKIYPAAAHTKCVTLDELEGIVHKGQPAPKITSGKDDIFINFVFPGAANGRKYKSLPEFPMVAKGDGCNGAGCGEGKFCNCPYQITVPYNEGTQIVFTSAGYFGAWGHPIHLHGHSFYVMKIGFLPGQDANTGSYGEYKGAVADLACSKAEKRGRGPFPYCNTVTWANPAWKGDSVPGLSKNPVRKDTVILPPGGYAVVRIRSDNPGKWICHCHIDVHTLEGMAMVLNEAPEKYHTLPPGFPKCGNFYNDKKKDKLFADSPSEEPAVNDEEVDLCGGEYTVKDDVVHLNIGSGIEGRDIKCDWNLKFPGKDSVNIKFKRVNLPKVSCDDAQVQITKGDSMVYAGCGGNTMEDENIDVSLDDANDVRVSLSARAGKWSPENGAKLKFTS